MDAHGKSESGGVPKVCTGISGLDEITRGGLPAGRPTLLSGGPGCGKTMLAMEFICRGAMQFDEPGIFVSFEESPEDLEANFAECTFGLSAALASGKVRLKTALINHEPVVESGEYTLDGLLVRLGHWVDSVDARRLVLDSLDSLLSRFTASANLRYELSRLLQWSKDRGLTTIVTSERNDGQPQRYSLQEYISDCVILLDHRVAGQVSKRRLRVLKYRGSGHGKDEYPFLIGELGISVLPITSLGLDSLAPRDFVTSGITGIDAMLDGNGYFRGSTVLVTGAAGTGKSSLAACFAEAVCRHGGKCIYFSFEESASQLVRNMASIGIDLETSTKSGSLRVEPLRPSAFGLEEHLARVHAMVDNMQPDAVVMDPITSFTSIGDRTEVKAMLIRLFDFLKSRGITVILPSLTPGFGTDGETETAVSSLVDTWIIILFVREQGQRRRQLYIHKARGIAHSQELGELTLSTTGPAVTPYAQNAAAGLI